MRIDAVRQGQLNENAMNGTIGVERAQSFQNVLFARCRRHFELVPDHLLDGDPTRQVWREPGREIGAL